MIREISRPEDSAVIFPRGFGKSTWEKIDTIHDIVYSLEPVIVYVSATLKDAAFHFESIKAQLEENQLLRAIYGDLVPPMKARESVKWTNTHFETTNGVNVVARGANKGRGINIKNQRPTKIIIDDAEDDEQVLSSARREKYREWLYGVIIPSLDTERGKLKVIGTVIHIDCEVLNFYKKHGGIMRKAIESGESIWPQRWSISKLQEEKERIGTRAFMKEYQQEPTNYELARIKTEWIDDNTYVVLPKNTGTFFNTVIAIDPQSGEKRQADEYAVTAVGWYNGDAHRYVLEQVAGHGTQLDQAKEVVRMWLQYPNSKAVGVEKIMTQVAVYQLLLAWRSGRIPLDGVDATNRNIPIVAISPEGKDKIARFEKHEPAIERGELHLRPEMKVLREQILFLGTGALDHDDRVDSLIMALDLSLKHTTSNKQVLQDLATKNKTAAGNLWREKF